MPVLRNAEAPSSGAHPASRTSSWLVFVVLPSDTSDRICAIRNSTIIFVVHSSGCHACSDQIAGERAASSPSTATPKTRV
ncbi:hypothetical protein H9L39_00194 [Fusarium oxysporum f. sp. albedinis]|nr:hypothetical protein H9L39_00194 [Fusarium oxysporum f. sp. albedinis]